ncbi:hypothetical protein B0H63DRAFT_463489 [Podospora didyma]|uniref:Uncharacterized protein n=1 Tax=Podospora didyma TaxID=330526 RepID=A0AAE0NX62_9PEZI|nr:hypothetical protein B0H63DRAFT_463489 [Podospora didyma]
METNMDTEMQDDSPAPAPAWPSQDTTAMAPSNMATRFGDLTMRPALGGDLAMPTPAVISAIEMVAKKANTSKELGFASLNNTNPTHAKYLQAAAFLKIDDNMEKVGKSISAHGMEANRMEAKTNQMVGYVEGLVHQFRKTQRRTVAYYKRTKKLHELVVRHLATTDAGKAEIAALEAENEVEELELARLDEKDDKYWETMRAQRGWMDYPSMWKKGYQGQTTDDFDDFDDFPDSD